MGISLRAHYRLVARLGGVGVIGSPRRHGDTEVTKKWNAGGPRGARLARAQATITSRARFYSACECRLRSCPSPAEGRRPPALLLRVSAPCLLYTSDAADE